MTTDSQVAAIETGEHGDPFAFLGPHELDNGHIVVRTYQPDAERVVLLDGAGASREARRCDHSGLFEIAIDHNLGRPYRLRVTHGGSDEDIVDPYQFGPWLGETDIYLLGEGTHLAAFNRLGGHFVTMNEVEGIVFAVWAPNARRVSVVGDFNQWDGRRHPMRFHPGAGVWELFIPG